MPDLLQSGRRLWEIRPGEYVEESISQPVQAVHAQRGLVFNCSTGVLTGGKDQFLKSVLANPAKSGRWLFVYRLAAVVSSPKSEIVFLPVRINAALTGLTARNPGNARIGSREQSVARLHVGVGADLAGGLPSQAGLPFMSNSRTTIEPTLIIPPGITFGLSGPLPAASDAVLTYWWYESLPEVAG
jgi:hypothetical protein